MKSLNAVRMFAPFALLGLATPSRATELEPKEFVAAPPGTSVFLGYAVYGHDDKFVPVSGPDLENGTNLEVKLGIARFAHYFNIGDTLALAEVLQPFGTIDNVRVSGQPLRHSSGLGDTIFAAAVWPINDKKNQTYFGVTLYMTVPTGKYDKGAAVNLGGNRLVYNPELALSKGIAKNWSIDLTADLILYENNREAGASGTQNLEQKATVQTQAFLNYDWGKGFSTSIGYEGMRGGTQRLDGIDTGNRTHFDEVRFVASKFLTPKFQLLGEVSHQFDVHGGFRKDIGVVIRGLYVF